MAAPSAAAMGRLKEELSDKDRAIKQLRETTETLERDIFTVQKDKKEMEGRTSRLVIENENQTKTIKALRDANAKLLRESEDKEGPEESQRRAKTMMSSARALAAVQVAEATGRLDLLENDYYPSLLLLQKVHLKAVGVGGRRGGPDFAWVSDVYGQKCREASTMMGEREADVVAMLRRHGDLGLSQERHHRIRAEQNAIEAMQAERTAREEGLKEVTILREQVALLERSKVEWMRAMPEQDRLISRLTKERDHLEGQLTQYVHQSRDKVRSDEVELGRLLERERELKTERAALLDNTSKLELALTHSHAEVTELRSELLCLDKDRTTVIAKAHRIKSKYTTQMERLKGYEKDGEKAREILETEMAELRWTRLRANEALERETMQLRAEWEGHVKQLEKRVNELNTALLDKDKRLTYSSMELTAYKERDRYSKGIAGPPPQQQQASSYTQQAGYQPQSMYNNPPQPVMNPSPSPAGPHRPSVVTVSAPSHSQSRGHGVHVMSPQRQGGPTMYPMEDDVAMVSHGPHPHAGLPPYPARMY